MLYALCFGDLERFFVESKIIYTLFLSYIIEYFYTFPKIKSLSVNFIVYMTPYQYPEIA